jgi:NAD(P)H-flavin reductase
MAERTGVAVAGALALGMYSCTRSVPDAVSSSAEEEEEEEEEDGLPDHLGGGGAEMEMADEQPVVRLSVCSTCPGSQTLLSDLEDLCSWVSGVEPRAAGCMGACGMGPNAMCDHSLHAGIGTLDETLRVLEKVAWQVDPGSRITIPPEALARIELRSDASRFASSMDPEENAKAELLLTQAIDAEQTPAPAPAHLTAEEVARRNSNQLRKLHMLRSSVRGSQALQEYDGAVEDCDAVIEGTPSYSQAYLQKGKLLRRARRTREALACFEQARALGSSVDALDEEGYRMDRYMLVWLDTVIDTVRERLAEDAAVEAGSFGSADAGADDCDDSGDGSGRWIVEKIEGMAPDSCVYHLRNHPPAVPHPYPHGAWHVNVCIGGTVRECVQACAMASITLVVVCQTHSHSYCACLCVLHARYTPVSTAKEWERGCLQLLVKSYPDGQVSKRFAKLRQVSEYGAPQEEQNCWALVSAPALTLQLPQLTLMDTPRPVVTHVAIVVGGTGVAPALQILRELADDSADGAFSGGGDAEGGCSATLLYSSRTEQDVLCIDELRAVEQAAAGRISVRHTLTDTGVTSGCADAASDARSARVSPTDPQWITGRHYHFPSKWNPYKPKSGPLRTEGVEARLRGRIDEQMLASVLPQPGDGVIVVVCGPPSMWEDMREFLTSIGHSEANLVELKALSDVQMRERAAAGGVGTLEEEHMVPTTA